MLKIATGHSEDPETHSATPEALDMAVAGLDGAVPKAALVFAGIDTDLREMVSIIRDRYPDIELSGCTTDGELSEVGGFLEDSVVITLFASDVVDFTVGVGVGAAENPLQATAQAVAMARGKTDKDPALCIATPEGIGTNIQFILDGLRAALGAEFPIVGGAAADQLRFTQTSQFCNDEIVSNAVVVMLLSGPLIHSCGVATGYTGLGNRHLVTKAEGAVIHEIGGKPAVDLYSDYVQSHSIFFPLAVYVPERGGWC
ncbi:hypothetical protein G5B39_14020 (plasmid) [Rhodobacteraceae bacterium SC52]|nr:hypothetical protein G5B39_14020 [Rhodobacteraceae bacterium SC52]